MNRRRTIVSEVTMRFTPALFALAGIAFLAPASAIAFDACPSGAGVSYLPSPDGRAQTVFFDNFFVPAGFTGTCNDVAVPINTVPAGSIAVFSADYRGTVTLADGETAVLTATRSGVTDTAIEAGPLDNSSYLHSGVVVVRGETLEPDLTLDLTNASDVFSFGTVDTIDYLELGRTTTASVQASIDMVAAGRTAVVARLNGAGELLTGAGQSLEAPNDVVLLGAVGSHTVGLATRLNITDGVSFLGGAAWTQQSGSGGSVSGLLAAGTVRIVQPDNAQARFFGEIGAAVGPSLGMSFNRTYANGAPGGASVTGNTSGTFASAFVTGGVLLAPDPDNEVVFSGTLMRNWLGVNGYTETGAGNLFGATFAASTNTFDTLKASADWTHRFTTEFDGTLSAAVGKTFARDGTPSTVAFVGPVTGTPQHDLFVEIGARAGWALSPSAKLDAFVTGSAGSSSGSHVQVGTALHVRF